MRATLPAVSSGTGSPVAVTPLANRRDGCKDRWQIVELVGNAPFEAHLTWNTGDDANLKAQVVVPRSTRICLFASWIAVEAANRSNVDNPVICTVSDGYGVTCNQWEERGTGLDGGQPVPVPVPPFASHLQVFSAVATDLPVVAITAIDGQGTVRMSCTGDQQSDGPMPLGCTSLVTVQAPDGVRWTVVFMLTL